MVATSVLCHRISIWRGHSTGPLLAAVLTVTLLMDVGSPLKPVLPTSAKLLGRVPARLLIASWWLVLARVAVATGRLAFGIDRRQKAMLLASDFVAAVVFLAASRFSTSCLEFR